MPTKTIALLLLAYSLLASPSSAAIVQVKYEGVVNVVGRDLRSITNADGTFNFNSVTVSSGAADIGANVHGDLTGTTTPAGADTIAFSIGDRVWGEYFYDSTSPSIAGSIYASEHAAIRYLSINVSNGFLGAVNFGVINRPVSNAPYSSVFGEHRLPQWVQQLGDRQEIYRPDIYRVTNWPAFTRSVTTWRGFFDLQNDSLYLNAPLESDANGDGVLDGDGIADDIDREGHHGPDGYEIETPGDDPDRYIDFSYDEYHLESLPVAPGDPSQLGFPAPSGVFTQGDPVAIHLLMDGNAPPPSTAVDPLAPPALDAVETAKGSIYFGYFGTDDPRLKVEFALTKISVVPEPTSLMSVLASLAIYITWRRLPQRRSIAFFPKFANRQ